MIKKNIRYRLKFGDNRADAMDVGAALDYVDPKNTLHENIDRMYENGFLTHECEVDPAEADEIIDQEAKEHIEEVSNSLYKSIYLKFYHCFECEEVLHLDKVFQCETREEMIKHYITEHDFPVAFLELLPSDPYNPEYIILKHIIELMENHKGRSKYFTVSNMELWSNLCEKLNINPSDTNAPSKQLPRNILKKTGLLQVGVGEKTRVGYNSKGNRVYHINITDVDRAISKTNYGDLLIRLGLLDTTTLVFPEPTSLTSEKIEDGRVI
jgi:hypothetical protein